MHGLGSTDPKIKREEFGMYFECSYVQVNMEDGVVEGIDAGISSCNETLKPEWIDEIEQENPGFRALSGDLLCPEADEIKLQGSKLMLEKLDARQQDISNLKAKEFRLVINTCLDLFGDNDESHPCKSK
jgi:hypothetical protein